MAEKQRQRAKRSGGGPWHVPVAQTEVAEAGLHVDLAASEEVRADVARLAGLTALPRLEASFDVARHGVPRHARATGTRIRVPRAAAARRARAGRGRTRRSARDPRARRRPTSAPAGR